jgi:hypothetical protein
MKLYLCCFALASALGRENLKNNKQVESIVNVRPTRFGAQSTLPGSVISAADKPPRQEGYWELVARMSSVGDAGGHYLYEG